jgi:hypothetical protein
MPILFENGGLPMRGLLIAVGVVLGATAAFGQDRAMGKPPIPQVEGAQTCQVEQLSLLSRMRVTESRNGAVLHISARDPKQVKTVQNLAEMLNNCINASHRPPASEPAPAKP